VAGVTSPQRIGETEVHHRARERGSSKYGLSRTFRVILDLLAAFFFLRFHARPGHFFGGFGLALGAIGGAMLIYLAGVKFLLGENIGQRPMLFVAILMCVAALQFVTTGVLAELLTRTFFESSEHTGHSIAWQHDVARAGWKHPAAAPRP